MFSGRLAHPTVGALDWLASKALAKPAEPKHQLTGGRGEEDAYFYLRKPGDVMVARNSCSPRRGEIDLIGRDKQVLCFVGVKIRTTRDVKPAEAAVGHSKQHELAGVAREYLPHLPPSCQWRFDVVSVYYQDQSSQPVFELFQNAFPVS